MKTRLYVMLVLGLLAVLGAHSQETPSMANFNVWLPGKAWALDFDGTGFTAQANEIQPDGRRYFLAENPKTRSVVSVYLEASKGPARPAECKRSLEEKLKHNAELSWGSLRNVARRESGEMQILEFTLPELDGVPTNQKNVLGCLTKDDVFVDIHISKVFYKPADQSTFDALLASFHFVPMEVSDAPVVT